MPIRSVTSSNSYQAALTGAQGRLAAKNMRNSGNFSDFLSNTPSGNDNALNRRNLERLEKLHERIATVRGEILAGAINGQASVMPQLKERLSTLTETLKSEEQRLSGKLVNIQI